jgi:hypothetical protein
LKKFADTLDLPLQLYTPFWSDKYESKYNMSESSQFKGTKLVVSVLGPSACSLRSFARAQPYQQRFPFDAGVRLLLYVYRACTLSSLSFGTRCPATYCPLVALLLTVHCLFSPTRPNDSYNFFADMFDLGNAMTNNRFNTYEIDFLDGGHRCVGSMVRWHGRCGIGAEHFDPVLLAFSHGHAGVAGFPGGGASTSIW